MKVHQFFLIIFTILTLLACNKDSSCSQADWEGTYTGTIDCNSNIGEVKIVITSNGDNEITFFYEALGIQTASNRIEVNSCSIDLSRSDNLFSYTYTLTLDGDNISHQDISTALNSSQIAGSSSYCNIEATRD